MRDKKGALPPPPATCSQALEVLEAALRRANDGSSGEEGRQDPPCWGPPRLRPAATANKRANGQAAATYIELSFYRFRLMEADPAWFLREARPQEAHKWAGYEPMDYPEIGDRDESSDPAKPGRTWKVPLSGATPRHSGILLGGENGARPALFP